MRAEPRERVATVHPAVTQVDDPAGADRQWAKRLRANQHEADARMAAEAGDQLREGEIDLLEGHPLRPAGEVDQTEVARSEHNYVPLRGRAGQFLVLRPQHYLTVMRMPAHGAPQHLPGYALRLAHALVERSAHVFPGL